MSFRNRTEPSAAERAYNVALVCAEKIRKLHEHDRHLHLTIGRSPVIQIDNPMGDENVWLMQDDFEHADAGDVQMAIVLNVAIDEIEAAYNQLQRDLPAILERAAEEKRQAAARRAAAEAAQAEQLARLKDTLAQTLRSS